MSDYERLSKEAEIAANASMKTCRMFLKDTIVNVLLVAILAFLKSLAQIETVWYTALLVILVIFGIVSICVTGKYFFDYARSKKRSKELKKKALSLAVADHMGKFNLADDDEQKGAIALVAKNLNINKEECEQLLSYSQELKKAERADQAAKEEASRLAEKEAMKKQEESEWANAEKKAMCNGIEKYLSETRNQISVLRNEKTQNEKLQELAKNSAYLTSRAKPSHSDWASAGGFASAIAGPAAGAAVAMDIQANNAAADAKFEAEKEKRNADMLSMHMLASEAGYSAQSAQSSISELYELIEKLSNKLIDCDNRNKYFKCLQVDTSSPNLTESGNVRCCVTASSKEQATLFGSPATIDGSLLIQLADAGGKILAEGYYCADGFDQTDLSKVGFSVRPTTKQVLLKSKEPLSKIPADANISVKPENIWIIEI